MVNFITNLIQSYPAVSIILISLVITFLSMLVTKYFTDQVELKRLKDKQKECQAKIKATKDQKQIMDYQKEMMACSMEMMKHSFKPMFITFIPFIILFYFIRNTFTTTSLGGHWIWYYIIASLIFSLILRKVLKIQ